MSNHEKMFKNETNYQSTKSFGQTCKLMNLELTETSAKHLPMLKGLKPFIVDESACAHFTVTTPKMGAVPKTYRTSQERSACNLASQKQDSSAYPLTRNNINGKQNAYRCRTPGRNSGCGFTGRPC